MARKIEIEIVGDTKGLTRAFNDASDSTSKLGSTFASLGKAAVLGLGAVGVGAGIAGAKMIGMASDAAEVQSKLDVVFGKTLPGITQELDKFSQATGASRFEMREQAADLGALLVPMLGSKSAAADMSVGFVKLATDLGSFNNIPVAEALEKIRAGLVGESEPLRSLGVLLTEATTKEFAYANGIAKRGSELTEVQKVEARAGQIMAQTALAQGDATRTADSFSNQLKRLKNSVSDTATELGTALLPMASKVLTALNEGAQGVTNFLQKLSAAKGFQAKVQVVFEGLKELASEAIEVGKDIGAQIKKALGTVDWANAGLEMAKGIGEALRKGLPVAAQLATTIGAGFLKAIQQVDWAAVGGEIGSGLKQGAQEGVKKFITQDGIKAMTMVFGPGLFGVGLRKVLKDAGTDGGQQLGVSVAEGIRMNTAKPVTAADKMATDTANAAIAKAYSSGTTVGSNLAAGMAAGIAAGSAAAAIQAALMVNHAYSAASSAAQMHSPSRLFAKIGEGTVEGYILGITTKLPELKGKMAEAVQNALDAARAKVEAQQERLGEAFGKLGEYVARQFGAKTEAEMNKITAKWDARIKAIATKAEALTPAEQALKNIGDSESARSRQKAVDEAAAQLLAAEAMDEGVEKAKAVAAAHEAIRQAALANTIAQLELDADAQRKARDKQAEEDIAAAERKKARELQNYEELRRQMEESLDRQLEALGKRLQDHPKEYDKIQKQIIKLLDSYGVPMQKSGKLLGDAFADGIRASYGNVERAVKKLAQLVADFVPHSPAKKGPLREMPNWKAYMTDGFPSALNMAAGAVGGSGGSGGGAGFAARPAGGGGGGWPERVQLVVDGRVLTEVVRKEVQRTMARNR